MKNVRNLFLENLSNNGVKSHEAMTLTFICRTNFFWYALLQWCWGLKELATHETKREDKVVIADTVSS